MIIINYSCLLISLVFVVILTRTLEYSRNQKILTIGLAAVLPVHWTMISEPMNFSISSLCFLVGMTTIIISIRSGHSSTIIGGSLFIVACIFLIDPETVSYLRAQPEVSPLVVLLGKGFPQLLEIPGIILTLTYLLMGAVITLSVSFPGLYRVAAENTHQGKAAVHMIGGQKLAAALPAPKEPERYKEDKPVPIVGAFFLIPFTIYLLVSVFVEGIVFYQVLYMLAFPFCLWIGAATAPIKRHWTKWIMPSTWVILAGLSYIL